MYIFVEVRETKDYYRNGPSSGKVKVRLEQASGKRCLIVPYRQFGMNIVEKLQPHAVVISGFGGHFQSRNIEWFLGIDEVLHKSDIPILCICGSHQLLAFSFNKNLKKLKALRDEPIRRLNSQEDVPRRPRQDPRYDLSGFFVAEGFYPIVRVKQDPIFRGLPRTMIMRCSHYCEVKNLPQDFIILAKSKHCRIEAMRHHNRPLYGTQFHPEAYEEPFLHGQRLLKNFAQVVKEFWSQK